MLIGSTALNLPLGYINQSTFPLPNLHPVFRDLQKSCILAEDSSSFADYRWAGIHEKISLSSTTASHPMWIIPVVARKTPVSAMEPRWPCLISRTYRILLPKALSALYPIPQRSRYSTLMLEISYLYSVYNRPKMADRAKSQGVGILTTS